MNVSFKPTFIKDFKNLPDDIKKDVKRICIEIFPKLDNLYNFKEYKIKPIQGFKDYFRIKLSDYRIGFKKEDDSINFMRVKHRKDIYKFFP